MSTQTWPHPISAVVEVVMPACAGLGPKAAAEALCSSLRWTLPEVMSTSLGFRRAAHQLGKLVKPELQNELILPHADVL